MMEVVGTTGAIRRAKLQLNHHHQQTNTQLFTGQIPFLTPNQQCRSTYGEKHWYWYMYIYFHRCILVTFIIHSQQSRISNV